MQSLVLDNSKTLISMCRFEGQPTKDDIVITTGSEIGGLLVDGLGDGVLVEAPQLPTTELNFLCTMSFGLLQVRDLPQERTSGHPSR